MTRVTPVAELDLEHGRLFERLFNRRRGHLTSLTLDNGLVLSIKKVRETGWPGAIRKTKPAYGRNVQVHRDGVLIGILGHGGCHSMAWFRQVDVSREDRAFLRKFAQANEIDPKLLRRKSDKLGVMLNRTFRGVGNWTVCKHRPKLAEIRRQHMIPSNVTVADWENARRYKYLFDILLNRGEAHDYA